MKISQKFLKIVNIFLLIITFLFFTYSNFQTINHLLFINSFSEINTRIPGGIKFSIDNGITSYGMFEVGYKNPDPKLNGQSIKSNIYAETEKINTKFLETGEIDESYIVTSYKKGNGLYTRLLPFILYKFTSLFSTKYVYLKYLYLILSLGVFFRILFQMQKEYSFVYSFLFYFLFITNGFFIMFLRNMAGPFFLSMFPIFILSFKKIYTLTTRKRSTLVLVLILLPPTFIGNTQGPIVWLSFITALYLWNKNFKFLEHKTLIIKALIINGILYVTSEILWILQRIYFLNQPLESILEIIKYSFGKYYQSVGTNNLNTCSDVTYLDFFEKFLNIKVIDLIILEINISIFFILLLLCLAVYVYKFELNLKIIFKNNSHIIFVLLTNLLWFAFIKGAFSCHLHVYPRFLLLSFLPILFTLKLYEKK